MVFNCSLGETARIKIRLTETKHFKIIDTFNLVFKKKQKAYSGDKHKEI